MESSRKAAASCVENHPGSTVICGDSNEILFRAGREIQQTLTGERIPSQGEVDLLCGGPPCQGFSVMNRFQETQLSHCDFSQPLFFLLENIQDMIK